LAAEYLAPSVSWREFVGRVWQELYIDDVTGLAAEMSYYFVLSVFPFLIFLAALIGSLPFTGAWDGVLQWIMLYFPHQSQGMVFEIVLSLTQHREGFLSLGLLGTAWAASSGFMTLMAALNSVYEVEETRSFPRRLGLALVMIFVLAVLLLASFGLLSAGNWVDRLVADRSMGLLSVRALVRLTRWIASIGLLGVSVAILDRTMPNLHRPWRRTIPGVIFTVLGWLAGTAGFNLYTQSLGTFNKTYGVLGVFVILMVWIYLASLIVLAGAEINSELNKLSGQKGVTVHSRVQIRPPLAV
jgi:membrane protein